MEPCRQSWLSVTVRLDQSVRGWGLIPQLVMSKTLGKFLILRCLWSPCSGAQIPSGVDSSFLHKPCQWEVISNQVNVKVVLKSLISMLCCSKDF
jgi:hypothetical protein